MKLLLQDYALIVEALRVPATAAGGGAEKRGSPRLVVAAKLKITLLENHKPGRSFTALTRDISVSGLGLIQSVKLEAGTTFLIALPRSGNKPPMHVMCVVMHAQQLAEGVYGIGAEYVKIGAEYVKAVEPEPVSEMDRLRAAVLQ
jgi:hypothetical protein